MAKTKTITLIKDGRQVTYDPAPASVIDTLRNGRYTVTISRERSPRSTQQNALMWAWFTCIESETGTPRQDVHDYYCAKFLRKTIDWNGQQRTIVEGTSKQSKERMTTFLNMVQADAAAEFGITLPTPEDRYFEEFYRMYG